MKPWSVSAGASLYITWSLLISAGVEKLTVDSQSPKLVVVDLPSAGGEEGFAKQGGGRVLCGEMKNSACVCLCEGRGSIVR